MKKGKLIIILIIVLIVIYFSIKAFLLNYYNPNNAFSVKDESLNKYFSKETIKILKKDNIVDSNEYKGMSYPKLKDEFVLGKDEYGFDTYYLNKNNEEYKASFVVSTWDDLYTYLLDGTEENGIYWKNTNDTEFLKRNNIENIIDLYEYILEHNNKSINIFSSMNDIKMNYFSKIALSNFTINLKTSLIEGDYSGFFQSDRNDYFVITLINDNQVYTFTFFNYEDSKYFDIEYVKDFISKVSFSKK